MPAVIIHLRWPDGQQSTAYSPSTSIGQHLQDDQSHPLSDFLQRAKAGLHAAAERVREGRGFYRSSAMDTWRELRRRAQSYSGEDLQIEVLALRRHDHGNTTTFGER